MAPAKFTAPRRTLRLARMTARAGVDYSSYLVKGLFAGDTRSAALRRAAHRKVAERVRRELELLRGPAMKLGQLLSLQTSELPEELVSELGKLQMQAPPMHPSLVTAQVRRSLGASPEEIFKQFEPVAFAAASFGQVHRAVTREGDRVVVKVQYPGIADAAAADLRALRMVARGLRVSGHLPEALLQEIETQILAEADYLREARNIARFAEALAPLRFVTTPQVFPRYCGDAVLTMSEVPGAHLGEWLARRPGQRLRDRVGERLLELFCFQLLRMKALHADPHWGNYLLTAEGNIGLVDFGCVKDFDETFYESVRRMYLYPGSRHSAAFRAILQERYAKRGQALSRSTFTALADFSETFYRRVYPPEPARDADRFDFGDAQFLRAYVQAAARLAGTKGILPEDVFLARAELGLYNTLHQLKARVRTSAVVRTYLQSA